MSIRFTVEGEQYVISSWSLFKRLAVNEEEERRSQDTIVGTTTLPTTHGNDSTSCSPLLLSSLEFSDTQVYKPHIRARLGTASHCCDVVVLKLR